jgi:hypothetical protein
MHNHPRVRIHPSQAFGQDNGFLPAVPDDVRTLKTFLEHLPGIIGPSHHMIDIQCHTVVPKQSHAAKSCYWWKIGKTSQLALKAGREGAGIRIREIPHILFSLPPYFFN